MTKKEIGEFMIEMGSFLMALPWICGAVAILLYSISLIEFNILTIVVLGVILYYLVSFFLIHYGRKISEEERGEHI